MTELENDILGLFRYAAHPGRQIGIIADLAGRDVGYVIDVLKKYGRIPKDTTKANYRKLNRERLVKNLSEERLRYIVGSLKPVQTIAHELNLPLAEVMKIRRDIEEVADNMIEDYIAFNDIRKVLKDEYGFEIQMKG